MPFRRPRSHGGPLLPTSAPVDASSHRGRVDWTAAEVADWRATVVDGREPYLPPGEARWIKYDGDGVASYVEVCT